MTITAQKWSEAIRFYWVKQNITTNVIYLYIVVFFLFSCEAKVKVARDYSLIWGANCIYLLSAVIN